VSDNAGDHFRLWLRAGLSGCEFAMRLASKAQRVAIELHVDAELPPTDWLNSTFDVHAEEGRVVIAVFPRITNEASLVGFLNALSKDSRWQARRRKKTSPSGGVLVGLEWTTRTNDVSETMGFAPFASMPVPRRAPFVAIATWPGTPSNPLRGQGDTPAGKPGSVSFLDASHGFAEADYEKYYKNTGDQIARMMTVPPDDASLYRRTAFVIPPEAAAGLAID
jgi:hypothetical protein